MDIRHYKSIQQDVYSENGVWQGTKTVLVSSEIGQKSFGCSAVFDYEEYEQKSAYGYDHSAYAPDLGDK